MGDLFAGYSKVTSEYENRKAEVIAAYEEHYHKLLRNYKEEIKFIQEMMEGVRQEREKFYKETLPQIEKNINEDNILSEDAKREWLCELKSSMEKSFCISEDLIEHYVTSNLKEFRQKLKVSLNEV